MKITKVILGIAIVSVILMCLANTYANMGAPILNISGEKNVEVNKTIQLKAERSVAYGTYTPDPENNIDIPTTEVNTQDVTEKCSWVSSDTNVAKVDNKGIVTGVSEGKAIITAQYDVDKIKATYEITVNAKNTSDNAKILFKDETIIPTPAMLLNKEYNFFISLYNITNEEKRNIKITIDNEDVAKLVSIDLCEDTENLLIANVKFVSLGSAKITATLNYNGKTCSNSYNFEVIESIYRLQISTKETTELPEKLKIGDEIQLRAIFNIFGGSVAPKDVTESDRTTWTSSNESVAKVNNKGLVTAESEGTAVITAKYNIGDETTITEYNLKIVDPTKTPTNGNETSTNKETDNNTIKNNNTTTNNNSTTAKNKIPDAGLKMKVVFLIIIGLIILVAITKRMYKKYEDIK